MTSLNIARSVAGLLIVAGVTGCSTWHSMDKTEGAVAGGAGGAIAGAVVAGPVGAVVGGVGGAYVGQETAGKDETLRTASSSPPVSGSSGRYDPLLVRRVQQALNDKGFNSGSVDGHWGHATEDAVRKFQGASGLPQTGGLETSTLTALGVAPPM